MLPPSVGYGLFGGEQLLARFEGVLGIPAILPMTAFEEIRRVKSDEGARGYLRRSDVEAIAVDIAAAAWDVDSPEDLA